MAAQRARGTCDFVFLVDATQSMRPCMDALKANISLFIEQLTAPQTGLTDWRGKVVAFRDFVFDERTWFEDQPFVQDADLLKAQLAALRTSGGGDEPESLLDAIFKLMNSAATTPTQGAVEADKWRQSRDAQRVIIVFTDATYHRTMSAPGAEGGGVVDVMNRATAGRFVLIMYAPDHECYDELGQLDRAEWHPIEGPDFIRGLAKYTSDVANFQRALRALAASISASAAVPLA